MITEINLEYESLEQLSYYDPKTAYIDLYYKNKFVEYLEVWTDKENKEKEYIIINSEMVYLDTIENVND